MLDRDLDLHGDDLAVSAVRQSLFSIVCRTRSSEATAIAYRLAAAARRPHPHHPQLDPADARGRRAMELSATRPTPEVHALLDGADLFDTDPEFGLLLLHELVLRRKGLPRSAARYSDWAVRCGSSARVPAAAAARRGGASARCHGHVRAGSRRQPLVTRGHRAERPGAAPHSCCPDWGRPWTATTSGIRGLFRDWGVEGYAVDVQRRTARLGVPHPLRATNPDRPHAGPGRRPRRRTGRDVQRSGRRRRLHARPGRCLVSASGLASGGVHHRRDLADPDRRDRPTRHLVAMDRARDRPGALVLGNRVGLLVPRRQRRARRRRGRDGQRLAPAICCNAGLWSLERSPEATVQRP